MIRVHFATSRDHVQGNYLLTTNTVARRLRGHVFEIAEQNLKLLDEHQLDYTLVPIPEPCGSADDEAQGHQECSVENLAHTAELQRRKP